MNGGHVDQLHTFADRADASDRAQSARISLPSDIDRVVQHHTPANKGANEEIGIVLKLFAASIGVLSLAGGRGIIHHDDRQVAEFANFSDQINLAPGAEGIAGRVNRGVPIPKFKWRCDANAADSRLFGG